MNLNYELNIFNRVYRKSLRSNIVNNIIQRIEKSKLPKKTVLFIIKSFHFQTPIHFISILIFMSSWLIMIFIIPLFIAFLLYIYFDGCFVTHLEYKLSKLIQEENKNNVNSIDIKNNTDNVNIIDPFLLLLNIEINEDNRYWYTLYISIIYLFVSIAIIQIKNLFEK
tara:strand:- start:9772 stop:10272 length:501 start_codon:yes stop_codon:yes gene_type:complete